MLKLFYFILLLPLSIHAQEYHTALDSTNTEAYFRADFSKEFYSSLKSVDLGNQPISKLFYYSYRITNNDSIEWIAYGADVKNIDSLAYLSFSKIFNLYKSVSKTKPLRNDAFTYIPVFLFYNCKDKLNAKKVEISLMEYVFGWQIDKRGKPEPVFRVYAPIYLNLPGEMSYFQKINKN